MESFLRSYYFGVETALPLNEVIQRTSKEQLDYWPMETIHKIGN